MSVNLVNSVKKRSRLPYSIPMRCLILIPLITAFVSCQAARFSQPTLKVDAPAAFQEASSKQNSEISTAWVTTFQSETMASLIQEALHNNRNLQASAARLRATRESTIISRARLLPRVTANSGTSQTLDQDTGNVVESYNLNFSASWEADLWGRLRDLNRATWYDYQETVANFRSAQLSLAANTAQSWCNLITAQQQVKLAEETLKSFKANLRVIERGYRSNTSRGLDVAFGRNNVASAERSLLARQLARNNAARSLEVLLGRYPAAELKAAQTFPTLPEHIPAGLPSELLSRRPDIVSARYAVLANASRYIAAKKNFLPSLSLTASGSNSSSDFPRIFEPQYLLFSAAASLSQTVYNGGALNAQARAALENHKAELEAYTQTALNAFREVESSLAIDRSLAKQEVFLTDEADKAGIAEKFAERAYTDGLANVTTLLEAQRRANNSRAALISLRNQRLQNRIDLHLAIGGSY